MLDWQPADALETKLAQLEETLRQGRLSLEESVPLFASLFSLPVPEARYPPLNVTPQRQRQLTLEALVALLMGLTEHQPMLFILEDVHWTDPSTLEMLDLLMDQVATAALLVVLTCRPEFAPPWGLRSYLTPIALTRFTRSQVEAMVEQVTEGRPLPAEVVQQIVEKTDGVPLFIEEMTKMLLESGVLYDTDGHYELAGPVSSLAIPTTLQDSLMARLDRLGTAKRVAQLGATIGRRFSYALLNAVSPLDEETLQRELGRLVSSELVYQRGIGLQATYSFKHALIRDAAYESLLKSTRQQVHQHIAQVLAERFPGIAETQPELLAHHYTEADLYEQAIAYWQRAGQRASARSAYREAISHLTTGLGLLSTLPATSERAQHELTLQVTLGPALIALKGQSAPEVAQVYTRARELAQQVGDTLELCQVLWGLRVFYLMRAELHTARELAEQALSVAQRHHDPDRLMMAHMVLGGTLFYLGDVATALRHLEQGRAFGAPQPEPVRAAAYGREESGASDLSYEATALWLLGYADQALQRSHEALALARELAHPVALAITLHWTARLHACRREWRAVYEYGERVMALSAEHGFAQWFAVGMRYRGWALVAQGQVEEGMAQMHQSLTDSRAMESKLGESYGLTGLAEAHAYLGQVAAGLRLLAEAQSIVEQHAVRWVEAEIHRLKGELLLKHAIPDTHQAETCFQQALAVARSQHARSWELRAATSLARLWQSQDKHQDAYALLAPVYGWFTEGFDTADLKDVKGLLEQLA
jgi:predicted ATPase